MHFSSYIKNERTQSRCELWKFEGVKVLAMEKVFPMTQAGKEKLEQELEYLKSVKRKEVVERIKIARSFGDYSFEVTKSIPQKGKGHLPERHAWSLPGVSSTCTFVTVFFDFCIILRLLLLELLYRAFFIQRCN